MRSLLIGIVLLAMGTLTIQGQEWEVIHGPNYSISYPSDWSHENFDTGLMQFSIESKLESYSDIFIENANLVIEDLNGLTIDQYIDSSKQALFNAYGKDDNFEITELTIGQSGPEATWLYAFQNIGGVVKSKARVIFHNNKAHIITFTFSVNDYWKYESTGNRILKSFKIESFENK